MDLDPFYFKHTIVYKTLLDGERNILCENCGFAVRIDHMAPDLALENYLPKDSKVYRLKRLEITDEIGVGGYSTVRRCVIKGKPGEYAYKMLNENASTNEYNRDISQVHIAYKREVYLLSMMKHPNIIHIKGITLNPMGILLELCELGDLQQWIRERGTIEDIESFREREKIALDIALGMTFMHQFSPPIVHKDLKSPNILLTYKNKRIVAKIADFGISAFLSFTEELNNTAVKNPTWLAPEVLKDEPFTEKIDIYAFGIILWELASGKDFMGKYGLRKLRSRIIAGEREQIPDLTPLYIANLIQLCWNGNAALRPGFSQCVRLLKKKKTEMGEDPESIKVVLNENQKVLNND